MKIPKRWGAGWLGSPEAGNYMPVLKVTNEPEEEVNLKKEIKEMSCSSKKIKEREIKLEEERKKIKENKRKIESKIRKIISIEGFEISGSLITIKTERYVSKNKLIQLEEELNIKLVGIECKTKRGDRFLHGAWLEMYFDIECCEE